MKKLQRFFSTPVLLLGLGLLAFGIQTRWLGYYLDDWVFLYHFYRGGYERLAAYSFGVNRPLGAWPWAIGFTLLGYSPVGWQLWSLAWRLLTTLFLWMGWKLIWPEKKLQVSLASALFLVYPVFVQQTAAVTFSDHWICFALYALSILLMVLSIRRRQLYIPLTGLALLASGLQLFTLEYFVGLELARPLLLWFAQNEVKERKTTVKKFLLDAIPYALLLGVFLVWRFFWMPTPGFDRNKPEVLYGFITHPLQTLYTFSIKGIQDIVETVVAAWYKTYAPSTITLAPISSLISWGIAATAFLLAFAFFFIFSRKEADPDIDRKSAYPWMIICFTVMIAGFLPAWSIGEHLISGGNYSDRFGLAAMWGASLFIVSLASFLLRKNHKVIFICILIGLAAGYHFRLANEFRWAWENQSRLAWQMAWRIPQLQPRTSVYGDGTLANGSWVDIAWLNFLYGEPANRGNEDYWYFDLSKYKAGSTPPKDQEISESRFEHLSYQGNTSDSLVIQFKSVPNQCLWVVSSDDLPNPYLAPGVRQALALSNINRIDLSSEKPTNAGRVFPPEPAKGWCYYFQKAQLAVQEKQWNTVKELWQEASAKKLKTGVSVEYLPFIYGLAKAGDYEQALVVSVRSKSIDILMQDPICQTWDKVFTGTSEAQDLSPVRQKIVQELGCSYRIK